MKKKIKKYRLVFEDGLTWYSKDLVGIIAIGAGMFWSPIIVLMGFILICFDHLKIVEEIK